MRDGNLDYLSRQKHTERSPIMTPDQATAVPARKFPSLVARIGVLARSRMFRGAVVGLMILALERLTFSGYLTGSSIPPWDFLGSYNTDAYVWWSQGGFFSPIDWSSSAWAGYPSALVLQNSAWYLPVGIASLFGPYTLHSAAVVSAVHVALGAVGTYFLARAMKSSFGVGLFACAAGFFAVGYFSNAEHVDITRGYALIPWVLLVLSPWWSRKRIWAVPVATLVIWQTITGIYPGMLVALGYVAVVWVVFWQVFERRRLLGYLVPVGLSFLAAVLLSMPRLLPYALLQGGVTAGLPEASQLTPISIGTLLFGYGAAGLPNDISMRSFFVPAAVLALVFFARWRDLSTKAALAIGVPSVLLGMPFWPWYEAEQQLPGLGLSRFTMSDFKVFFILSLVLLACSGLTRLIEMPSGSRVPVGARWSLVGFMGFAAILTLSGIRGPYRFPDWVPGMVLLGLSACVIVGFLLLRRQPSSAALLSVVLIVLTVASGVVWANTTPEPWKAARVDSEKVTYGTTVDALVAQRSPTQASVRRPARTPLGLDRSRGNQLSVVWNGAFYSGKDAVGGYINLKGSETEARLQNALSNSSSGAAFAEFLAAPGSILTTGRSTPSRLELEECARGTSCGTGTVSPISYSPGVFVYHVSAPIASTGFFNEAYFKGWDAQLCVNGRNCSALTPTQSTLGIVRIDLPVGDYTLTMRYLTAGRAVGWVLFGVGVLVVFGCSVALNSGSSLVRGRTQRTRRRVTGL